MNKVRQYTLDTLDDMAEDARVDTSMFRHHMVFLLGDIANQLERIATALEGEEA